MNKWAHFYPVLESGEASGRKWWSGRLRILGHNEPKSWGVGWGGDGIGGKEQITGGLTDKRQEFLCHN